MISRNPMEKICLIAAMPQESGAFLHRIRGLSHTRLGPYKGIRFHLTGRNCLLITSGMGLKRAVDAARILLASENPDLLISFGIAGAVHADLQIGDVVIAEKTCLLEKYIPGQLQPLAILSKAALSAVTQVLHPEEAKLVPGTAITTRGSQVLPDYLHGLTNPILEMETIGIAQVAVEMGVPLLSIRSISDGPRAPIPLNLETVMDDNYNFRIGELIRSVFQHPEIVLRTRRMLRNTKKAADHAAMALFAVLNQPSSIISL